MTEATVIELRPRQQPTYTDKVALNDIHALLTTARTANPDLVRDIGLILARTGRPTVRGRHIEASTTESAMGWPVARVEAEGTTVTVRQDPAGPGLLVEITTRTAAERDGLSVTLDNRCLHHLGRPGGDAA